MNLTSSMAKTLVGSIIATVTVAPALLTGRMVYFLAMSAGMILMTASSISIPLRSTDGTLKWRESDSTSCRSFR